jgi:transposase
MASLAYHRNKKTGVTYVYSVTSYWDKEKKAPRNKQVCLGRLDPSTGEAIPSKRKEPGVGADLWAGVSADARVAGTAMLLDKLSKDTGLSDAVRRCFPETHAELMSLVYFIVQKGLPLSRCEAWSVGHLHPHGDPMRSQRISELLLSIGEADRQKFLSLWMRRVADADYLCYDITSISSYSKGNEYVRCGYNRDGEKLPQINLAMLFGQKSGLPAYYRRMPGNITDVATLRTTMKSMDFLGSSPVHFVLDRGFYSKANIDDALDRRHHFTIAVPSALKWVEEIIDAYYESIASPENYRQIDDSEALYVATRLLRWGERSRRAYLHVYYNARRAADEFDGLTRELLKYKEEVESGKRIKEHEESYARFLVIKETPKRGLCVSFNDEEIKKYRRRYSGFFCVMSTAIKDPMEALGVYRAKESVENSFDDLKNQLDMKRLRVHTSAAMDSRVFIQFLALILVCQVRNISKADKTLRNLTVREIMEQMETLVRIKFSGRHGQLLTEAGPLQRKIMEVFGLPMPT